MALITFKLQRIEYVNGTALMAALSSILPPPNNDEIDNATTVLIVDVDESQFPDSTIHEFVPSKIVFKTPNPQSLYLPLICYDDKIGTTSPPFSYL